MVNIGLVDKIWWLIGRIPLLGPSLLHITKDFKLRMHPATKIHLVLVLILMVLRHMRLLDCYERPPMAEVGIVDPKQLVSHHRRGVHPYVGPWVLLRRWIHHFSRPTSSCVMVLHSLVLETKGTGIERLRTQVVSMVSLTGLAISL
jgi:hypothetical protein